MTSKNREQREARALQEDTGWSYQHCLNLVRTKTEEEIDELIRQRALDLGVPEPRDD